MDDDMEIALLGFFLVAQVAMHRFRRRRRARRRHRFWVRPLYLEREAQGNFNNLHQEMLRDPDEFYNYYRMNSEQFYDVLHKVEPYLVKQYFIREPLSPGLCLSVTLRYLASGDSMRSLTYAYRIGKASVSRCIATTTAAIWAVLKEEMLSFPDPAALREIYQGFEERTQFPKCIGAIDGKHVIVQCFNDSGSAYFNYKGSFSVVLMGVCDSLYRFIYISVGSAGRESDGGVFQRSDIGQALSNETLPLPPWKEIPITTEFSTSVPPVIVGDAAFPLLPNLMKPYPGRNLQPSEEIFNYRLSRARRTIENTFGVMASKFRIFRKPIIASEGTVCKIVKSCVALHNWLRNADIAAAPARPYIPQGYVDYEDEFGQPRDGLWRLVGRNDGLQNLGRNRTRNSSAYSKTVRNTLATFFMKAGAVHWQWNNLPENIRLHCLRDRNRLENHNGDQE